MRGKYLVNSLGTNFVPTEFDPCDSRGKPDGRPNARVLRDAGHSVPMCIFFAMREDSVQFTPQNSTNFAPPANPSQSVNRFQSISIRAPLQVPIGQHSGLNRGGGVIVGLVLSTPPGVSGQRGVRGYIGGGGEGHPGLPKRWGEGRRVGIRTIGKKSLR